MQQGGGPQLVDVTRLDWTYVGMNVVREVLGTRLLYRTTGDSRRADNDRHISSNSQLFDGPARSRACIRPRDAARHSETLKAVLPQLLKGFCNAQGHSCSSNRGLSTTTRGSRSDLKRAFQSASLQVTFLSLHYTRCICTQTYEKVMTSLQSACYNQATAPYTNKRPYMIEKICCVND